MATEPAPTAHCTGRHKWKPVRKFPTAAPNGNGTFSKNRRRWQLVYQCVKCPAQRYEWGEFL